MSRNFTPTKFSTHEIFHPQNFPHSVALSTHAQIWPATFCYGSFSQLASQLTASVLDTQDPLSQAVPRVMVEEVNRTVWKAEARPKQQGQYLSNAEEPKDPF